MKQRYSLLIILFIVLLIAYADRVNASILMADETFLNDMDLNGKPVLLGLLMTLFLAPYALGNIIFSPFGDIFGPRKVMSVSTFVWIPAMILGGMSPTITILYLARILLGLAEGAHWPMQSKYVENWFNENERARANSLWLLGLILGPAFSVPLLVWLIQNFNWRMSFYLLAVLNLAPVFLIWFFTSDHPKKPPLDISNALQNKKLPFLKSNYKLIFKNPKFWILTFYCFCHASIWWGTIAWLPSYLKNTQGFSWTNTGIFSSLPYFLGAIAAIITAFAADYLKRRAPFAILSLLGATAGILLSLASQNNFYAALSISFTIVFLSIGLPIIWAIIQNALPAQASGSGAGLINGLGNAGAAFAPIMVGIFINLLGNFKGGFFYLAGLGILGMIAMTPLLKEKL